jgi:TusA-related sulfurtransferase
MTADVTLDTLGYFCPMPIIMTSKKIKELALGQILEVVSDDEGIKKDMPAWCDTTGHQMLGLEEEQAQSGLIYKVFVKKAK